MEALKWSEYYKDLDIPTTWKHVSYGNDALPSYQTSEDDLNAYHVWIDSHNTEERKRNSLDIYGLKNELAPRFHVVLCYGGEENIYTSDNFDNVVEWVKHNPKTKEQINLTKEYL